MSPSKQEQRYVAGFSKLLIEQAPLTQGFFPFCQHRLGTGVVVVVESSKPPVFAS